jgi:hypothetical protein
MLLREEYIAAFTHSNPVVRESALSLVNQCGGAGIDAARQALLSIEEHGFADAFLHHGNLAALPLDDPTAQRLLQLLGDFFAKPQPGVFPENLFLWLLRSAPAGFLADQLPAIRKMARDPEDPLQNGFLERELARRTRLDSTPPAELLGRLQRIPFDCSANPSSFPADFVNEAEDLIEFLGAIPELRSPLESLAAAWLGLVVPEKPPDRKDGDHDFLDHFWPVAFGVRLAGQLRLVQKVPSFIELFKLDADYMSESIQASIVAMHSLEALLAWGPQYPTLEWHARLYLVGCCDRIREPGADLFIEGLLGGEQAADLFEMLMVALSVQPTENATEQSAAYYRENQDSPEAREIAENLFVLHEVTGRNHADLPLWRAASERGHARMASSIRGGSLSGAWPKFGDSGNFAMDFPGSPKNTPCVAAPKTGRNDPCPCGSKKKYKKCCMLS